ncbi:MAG: peptidylprolyl isomerase [Opitutales bacterium]
MLKLISAGLSVFAATGLLLGQYQDPTSQPVNQIAAQVEDEIITWNDINEKLQPLLPQIQAESYTMRDFVQRQQLEARKILNNEINRILIVHDFREQGMQIPADYLENAFDDFLARNFNNDRAEYLEHLDDRGINELQFREELKEQLIVDYMRNRNQGPLSAVSPQQVQAYYEAEENQSRFYEEERVKLRMITLKAGAGETVDEVVDEATRLVRRLREGRDFAAMAEQFSEDERADEGGDWGEIERGRLREEITQAAFSIERGQVSDPLVVNESVYILKVEDKMAAGVQDLSKVRGEIEQAIATKLAREATARWIERLRDQYYWHIYSESMPATYAESQDKGTVEMDMGKPQEDNGIEAAAN